MGTCNSGSNDFNGNKMLILYKADLYTCGTLIILIKNGKGCANILASLSLKYGGLSASVFNYVHNFFQHLKHFPYFYQKKKRPKTNLVCFVLCYNLTTMLNWSELVSNINYIKKRAASQPRRANGVANGDANATAEISCKAREGLAPADRKRDLVRSVAPLSPRKGRLMWTLTNAPRQHGKMFFFKKRFKPAAKG